MTRMGKGRTVIRLDVARAPRPVERVRNPSAVRELSGYNIGRLKMRRILLAIAGYAIAAWWTSRTEAKAKREARARAASRPPRRANKLQGHAGERAR